MTTQTRDTQGPPAATLQIIRASIAGAPLLLALVATQIRPTPAEPHVEIAYVAAVFALAMLGPILLFQRHTRTRPTRGERATFSIIGWAMGESAALLGAVSYFLGNDPLWTLPGFITLAVALLLFPVPQDEPAR